VLADNAVDVGRHQNLLAEIPVMVLLTKTPILDRSQHQTAAQRPSPKVRRRW
jgi:glucokinase